MCQQQEDITLIKNILEDDYSSQKKFYDNYRTVLTDYLNSKYPYNIDIDDDVSEILIKIFSNLYRYDEKKGLVKTWIFSIANNYMIDKFRSQTPLTLNGTITITNNSISSEVSSDGYSLNTTQWNPDNSLWDHTIGGTNFESCDAVTFVSNHLSNCDFTFLNMKYTQGFNYEEIGNEFNISSNTVSNRVNYIKGKLKETLKEELN